jgi:hypothetical protein
MNPPTIDPREAVDGPVHGLLWRLRARLVTPPQEQQVESDLDRLFAAAREHAHEAPSVPVVAAVPEPVAPAAEVVHLRGYRLADRLGRVAAAFVLIAGVGGAIVIRPGEPVPTVGEQPILGASNQTSAPTIEGVPDEGAIEVADAEGGGTSEAAGEAGTSTSSRDTSDATSPADRPSTSDGSPADGNGPAPTSGSTGSSGGGGSGDTGSAPAPAPTAPSPSPKPGEGEAKDPGGFDGFGGGRLCPLPTDDAGDEGDADETKEPADGTSEDADGSDRPTCPTPKPQPTDEDEGDTADDGAEADDPEASDGTETGSGHGPPEKPKELKDKLGPRSERE